MYKKTFTILLLFIEKVKNPTLTILLLFVEKVKKMCFLNDFNRICNGYEDLITKTYKITPVLEKT